MPHPSSLAGDGDKGFFIKGGDGTVIGAGLNRIHAAALAETEAVDGGGLPVKLVSVTARERGKLSPPPHTGVSASELVARMDSSIAAVIGALPFAHRQRAHAPTPTQAQTVSNTLYTLPHTRMLTRTHTC